MALAHGPQPVSKYDMLLTFRKLIKEARMQHRLRPSSPVYSTTLTVLLLGVCPHLALCQANVLTFHNDNLRTGQNLAETVLTPGNVNSSVFGKLFEVPLDGKVDAQPLYVSQLPVPGVGSANVVFAATEHDSVYAFDANTGAIYWHVSLLNPGETTSDPRSCGQVVPEIGATATPVINLQAGPNGVIYVIGMSKDASGNYFQRLHALDLTTGAEQLGGPIDIHASYPGSGDESTNGTVFFNPKQHKERAALLLDGGKVYTSWSSHCDIRPYTGWLIAYDAFSLAQTAVLNFAPNGEGVAVWASGAGPAADGAGWLFFNLANGTFDTVLNAQGFPAYGNYGNAFLRVATFNNQLIPDSYWTMYNTIAESNVDRDLGSGGILLLPPMADSNGQTRYLAVGAGKDASIYVTDRTNMGGFNPNGNSNIYQELPSALAGSEFGMPAWFNGTVYFGAVNDRIAAYPVVNARLLPSPASVSPTVFGYPGATPSISANGNSNGILWAVENGATAVLHAYDAANLGTELYNSNQVGARDSFGTGNKYITPTIANGKVFVGTTNSVAVFGLLHGGQAPVQIVARHSGKCLDVPASSPNPGTQLVQYQCSGGSNQQWNLSANDDGSFEITSVTNGMALDVAGEFLPDGIPAVQWPYWGGPNEKWKLQRAGDGYYQLVAEHSGKCLDVAGGPDASADNTPVQQWSCWGGSNQQWQLVPVR
jgi:hypothetical protein